MNIKQVISSHGFSVNSLARKMGVWQSALNQVANGQNPTIGKLKEVAAGLDCHWLEFFADEITADDLRKAFPKQLAECIENKPTLDIDKVNGNTGHEENHLRDSEDPGHEGEESAFSKNASPEAQKQNDAPQQAEAVKAVRFTYQCPACGRQIKVCISEE